MNAPTPFVYKVSEEDFMADLLRLIAGSVTLPEDDQWHSINLSFDIFCGKEPGSFILSGSC